MSKQILHTQTIINRIGENLGIFTFFSQRLEDISFFISQEVKSIEGVDFLEGLLGFTKCGYEDVSFFVDENGDLIVLSNNSDRFEINEESGELQITE